MRFYEQSFAAAAAAILVGLGALAGGALGGESQGSGLELRIELPQESFMRGNLDPVQGLIVTLTVTNKAITPSSLPEPRLDPLGGTDFEIYLKGAPYGVPTTPQTPARTPVKRHVALQPVGGNVTRIPGHTIAPGASKQFKLNVGRNYAFRVAGRYEMTCLYQGERSNSVTFEVLPLKRVDVIPPVLLMHLADYELGVPDFPFMFYIAEGQDRFDQIIYLVRRGKGAYEHFEYHGLAKVAPGVTPEMMVAGLKVGVLVPDKTNDNLTRFFLLDFGPIPMKVESEEFIHDPGRGPSMTLDGSGKITAR